MLYLIIIKDLFLQDKKSHILASRMLAQPEFDF